MIVDKFKMNTGNSDMKYHQMIQEFYDLFEKSYESIKDLQLARAGELGHGMTSKEKERVNVRN